jgi:hypothetical protein
VDISFLFQTAIDIAEGLLDENDEIPQVWYLIGWANYLMGEDFKGNARFYLNKCKKVKSENLMHQQKIVRLLILYYHFDQQTIIFYHFSFVIMINCIIPGLIQMLTVNDLCIQYP